MSVLVVGLNYRNAPLPLLERFAVPGNDLPKALHGARSSQHVREAVVLSTCNRTEVYAVVDGFHSGLGALKRFLAEFHHVAPEEFADRLSSRFEDEAAEHLFGVASGIDSMVVGEPQILTQVRRAFTAADEEGAVGATLSALFRQAIKVGRRARAETDIARSAATLANAGVGLARSALGRVRGRTVLVVGAGKMSDLAAAALGTRGAHVLVANRTEERAAALAARIGGEHVTMTELGRGLAAADLVLSSTGSPDPVITHEMVATAMAGREDRPLFLLDLAVPRDVEAGAAAVPGVTITDMDDLRDAVAPDREQLDEVARVRGIVAEEVEKFAAWQRAHVLAPLVAALKERGDRVRAAEVAKAMKALQDLSAEERAAVDAMARAIVSKLLHDPIVTVKEHAGTRDGDALVRALRQLFDLSQEGGE